MNPREEKLRNQSRRLNEITPTKHGENKPYIFVSYKSDDWRDALEDIAYTLHRKYGIRVYYDKSFESSNQNWTKIMKENIESDMCVAVLICLTPKYLTSYATLLEVLTSQTKGASELDYRSKVKPIVPVVLDDTRFNMNIKKLRISENKKKNENDKLTGIKKIEWDAFQNVMKDITNEKNKISSAGAKDACEILNSIENNQDLKIADVISAFDELEESITENVNKRQLSTFFTTLYETLCGLNDEFMESQKAYMDDVIGIIDKSLIREDFDCIPMTPREEDSLPKGVLETEDKEMVEEAVSEKKDESAKEKQDVAVEPEISENSKAIENKGSEEIEETIGMFVYFQGAAAEIVDGKYIVKKDSLISKSVADSCPEGAKRVRNELMSCGKLVEVEDGYCLVEDHVFKSASGAACFVAGSSVSGTVAWKENATNRSTRKTKVELNGVSKVPSIASNDFLVSGMEVYVKKHEDEIGTITEEGTVSYGGRILSLNQFVQVVLGPGSRNAYLYVFEKASGKSLAELRENVVNTEADMDCVGSEIPISNEYVESKTAEKRDFMDLSDKDVEYFVLEILDADAVDNIKKNRLKNTFTLEMTTSDDTQFDEDGQILQFIDEITLTVPTESQVGFDGPFLDDYFERRWVEFLYGKGVIDEDDLFRLRYEDICDKEDNESVYNTKDKTLITESLSEITTLKEFREYISDECHNPEIAEKWKRMKHASGYVMFAALLGGSGVSGIYRLNFVKNIAKIFSNGKPSAGTWSSMVAATVNGKGVRTLGKVKDEYPALPDSMTIGEVRELFVNEHNEAFILKGGSLNELLDCFKILLNE